MLPRLTFPFPAESKTAPSRSALYRSMPGKVTGGGVRWFLGDFPPKLGFLRLMKQPRGLGCRLGKERSGWRMLSRIQLLGAAPVHAGFP